MKLRVCPALRHCLLMTMVTTAVTVGTHGAYGGIMHSDVTMQTYTDFGQNKGYYAVGGKVNALLDKLRYDDEGIIITYTDGQDPRNVASYEQGMINFSGTHDQGHSTALGPNFLATVEHNGSLAGSFNERNLGSSYAINYDAIDIRNSKDANGDYVFRLTPDGYDYMLQRQSKIITDVTSNSLYSGVTADSTFAEESTAISGLIGDMLYHSGAGTMQMYDEASGSVDSLTGAYNYITGSVDQITNAYVHEWSKTVGTNTNSVIVNANSGNVIGGADDADPLPWGSRGGDSGSPTFVWNETTKQYEYIAAVQSGYDGKNAWSQMRGAVSWTHKTLSQFDKVVDMSTNRSTVYLNAINTAGDTYTDAAGNTATVYSGNVTDAAGNTIVSYNGIQTGNYTWKSLLGLKDTDNWYANSGYLNQNAATLFHNSNLVFESASGSTNTIILKDTVDLGVGYAEFSGGSYTIQSEGTEGNLFNHAGYVINEGAEVHLQLTNPADYMFEWRKIGEGALYIDGTGDTNALLNVGGTGTTYLSQTDGYAAYNVLANSGATVQITGGVSQIKRDFTFGAGGGKLDMYGNSMTWNNSNDASADGFTIHALTEEAIITNTTGVTTLTVTDAATSVDGSNTFLGSFQDTANGALKIVYNDSDATWTLHSIHTDLSNNANSGFEVAGGKVVLSGTITEHAMGSTSGYNTNRLVNENDWHYADATMNVTVNNSGTFELGSHARLTGNVTVNNNGTFVMHQGVNHRYEHMEGSANAKDTNEYAGYYGLKGNVTLNGANTSMKVQLGAKGEDVDSTTTYAGSISGTGSLTVDAATKEATLHLSGDNSGHTGTKTLAGGTLTAANMAALGDVSTNKWKVEAGATFVMGEGLNFSAIDDTATGGVIALTEDQTTQLGVNSVIGAYEGKTVQYGTADKSLDATADGQWHLGGGGGTLVVNFKLTGANTLVLGDGYSTGEVKLTNTGNTFSGGIVTTDGVYLTYEDAKVLGTGTVDLAYRSRMNSHGDLTGITTTSRGTFYVDDIAAKNIDLSSHPELSLGAAKDTTITGNITVATGAAYRFGGGTGVLTIDTVLSGAHGLEIDAHTHAGNKVILTKATTLTGSVYVYGYNRNWTDATEGDMTLVLKAHHAFDSASKVSVIDNGVLDINGTTQVFKDFKVEDDGAIIDSSADFSGNLTLKGLNNKLTIQQGAISVGKLTLDVASGYTYTNNEDTVSPGAITTNTLTKTGEGTLQIDETKVTWNNLVVAGGLVQAGDGKTIAAGKTVTLSGSGHLEYTGWTQFNADVTMSDESKLTLGRYQLNGDVKVTEDANVTIHKANDSGDTHVNVYGSVDVAAGANLNLTAAANWAGFKLWGQNNNASGGTITVCNNELYLASQTANSTQTVGGTLNFTTTNKKAQLDSAVTVDGVTHKLDTVNVANAGTTLYAVTREGKAVTWDVQSLTGAGKMYLQSEDGSSFIIRKEASLAEITSSESATQQVKLQSDSASSVDVSSKVSGNIAMEIASDAKLSAANTYTGGTTVTGGTLTTANASALGTGGLVLNNNGLAMESDLTVKGAMTSAGGSVNMGGNTLNLTAAGNSLADTALSNGTVSVGSGASLSLSGMITMSGASFDVDGSVDVASGSIFFLNTSDFGDDKTLTLSVGSGSFTSLTAANFVLDDLTADQYTGFTITQSGSSITLSYTGLSDNNFTWNGGSGSWDEDTAKWTKPTATGSVAFTEKGNVTFGANFGTSMIDVASGITAANMTVAGTYMYTGNNFTVSNNLTVKEGASAQFVSIAPDVKGNVLIANGAEVAFMNTSAGVISGSVTTDGSGKLRLADASVTVNGTNSKLGNVELGHSTLSLNQSATINNLTVKAGLNGGASTLNDISTDGTGVTINNLTLAHKSAEDKEDISLSSDLVTVSGMKLTDATITNSSADITDSVNGDIAGVDFVMGDIISGKGSVSASTVEFVAGGEATLASGSELKLTATGKVLASGGKMTLESGAVLDMTGTGLNDGKKGGVHDGNITNILNSVQGAGTLKLATTTADKPAELTGSADVHTHVEVDGMLNLNAWKTSNGAVVTLHEDASLTTTGELRVQSTAVVDVNGGALEAQGGIKLGHSTAKNTGTLKLTDGTVTTTSIGAVAAHANNKLIMNGGTLEFTQNDASAIGEGITTELNAGTLKAEQSSWYVDRNLTLGGVTVDAAAEKTITFNGGITNTAGTTLNVTGDGAMVLNGATSDINGTLNVAENSTLRLSGATVNLSANQHVLGNLNTCSVASTLSGAAGTTGTATTLSGDAGTTLNVVGGMTLDVQKMAASGTTLNVTGGSTVKASGATHTLGTTNVDGNGTLELHGNVSMTNLNMDGVATVSGDGVVTTQFASFGNNGGAYDTTTTFDGVQLKIVDGEKFSVNGVVDSNHRFKSGAQGVATELNATINVLNDAVVDDRGSYYGVTGNLTITGDDSSGGTFYIDGIRLSDAAAKQSSLNIGKNAHFVITGDTAMSGNMADGTGSFALAHWNTTNGNSVNIDGKLTSNAVISTWDGGGTINVKDGGELNLLKGLANNDDVNGERSQTATVDVQSGARLNAAGGTHNQYLVTNLHTGATLGVIAGVSDTEVNFTNNINIGTAGATGEIVFDTDAQNVDADTYMLSKGQGVDVVLSGNNTYAGTNTIRVTGAGALHVASAKGTNGISIAGRNGKDATLTNLTSFSRSGSKVTAAGASSSNRSVISNAMIDIAEGSTFDLSHAVVTDTSRITDDSAFFRVNDVQLDVTNGVNAKITGTGTIGSVTLKTMGAKTAAPAVDASASVLAIESTLMDTVTVKGSSLTIHLDKFSDIEKKSYDYVRLSFTDGTTPAQFDTSLVVTVKYGGEDLASPVYFAQTDVTTANSTDMVTSLYIDVQNLAVPEPTTATLSLLGLAGLMLRRRRK